MDTIPLADPLTTPNFTGVERRYREQIVKHYSRLSLTGLPERDPGLHDVPLERIYVNLTTEVAEPRTFDPVLEQERVALKQELAELEKQGRRADRRRMDELLTRIERLETEARRPQTISLSVADALRQYRRVAAVGGPGSGKTTLTRWLALTFAQNVQAKSDRLGPDFAEPRLPILIELRRFTTRLSGQSSVPDLAAEIASFISGHAYYPDVPAEFVLCSLAEGRCILLLDGLDEIADLAARQELGRCLDAFLSHPGAHYGDNLVVVTSRPHGYQDIGWGGDFKTCRIKPFSPDDVDLFIRHWYEMAYGDAEGQEADALTEAVHANERVAELATNPLLCTIIAIVYRNNRVLPNRRFDLYLKCCEELLDTWERNKVIRESGLIGGYDWQTMLQLLAPLAYWLHGETERLAAPEEQFVVQLATVLVDRGLADEAHAEQEARRFLSVTRDRSGLLQGRGDGTLEFAHRTFQEYLAARHIAAQSNSDYIIDLVMMHLHEAWWREVHLLTIGHLGSSRDSAPQASALLLAILGRYRPPLSFLSSRPFTLLRLPAWLIAETLPQRQIHRRLAWVLGREFMLAGTGYTDCTPFGVTDEARNVLLATAERLLLQIVGDPGRQREEDDLLAAAHGLLRGQASHEVMTLLVAALTDPNPHVQQAAAGSLGRLGEVSHEVMAALVAALADPNPYVQQAASGSLQQLGEISHEVTVAMGAASHEVVAALVAALDHPDADVRRAAAGSLGQLGAASHEVVAALVEVLLTALADRDQGVRQTAAGSLGQLGWVSPEAATALVAALADSDLYVQQAVACCLGQRNVTPEHVAMLMAALGHPDEDMRRATVDSLRVLGAASPEAVAARVAALMAALADRNQGVRRAAADSLWQLRSVRSELVAELVAELTDPDPNVRRTAASRIGHLGWISLPVRAGLLASLDDPDRHVRMATETSLSQLGLDIPEMVANLMACLTRPESDIRRAAIILLGLLAWVSSATALANSDPRVVVALEMALSDPDWRVREAAARCLNQLAQVSPEVVAKLVTALTDPDPRVRREVVTGLGQWGRANPEMVAKLVTALADPDRRVRREAVTGLGQLGQASPEVVAELVTALNAADFEMRWTAADSLVRLAEVSQTAVTALVTASADRNSAVREVAVSSLGRLGQASPEVIAALAARLADLDPNIQRAAASGLEKSKISDEAALRPVLIALNHMLHDWDDLVRRSALEAARKLLDGRPIPGSRWTPLAVRRARARRLRRVGFWAGIIAATLIVTLGVAWLLTGVDPNSLLGRFLLGITILVALGSGLAQILGRELRDPWDKG